MSWRCCGNRWRRMSYRYNRAGVLNINIFIAFAERLLTFGARAESNSCPLLW